MPYETSVYENSEEGVGKQKKIKKSSKEQREDSRETLSFLFLIFLFDAVQMQKSCRSLPWPNFIPGFGVAREVLTRNVFKTRKKKEHKQKRRRKVHGDSATKHHHHHFCSSEWRLHSRPVWSGWSGRSRIFAIVYLLGDSFFLVLPEYPLPPTCPLPSRSF